MSEQRLQIDENTRFYSWDIITYLSEAQFLCVLKERFSSWAYIYHDKDGNEPHWHIVGSCVNKVSFKRLLKDFDSCGKENTRLIPITKEDLRERYEYLDHRDEPSKYQYDAKDIRHHDQHYWQIVCKDIVSDRTANDEFLDDLLSEQMSIEQMGRKYGRDFMKNYKSYLDYRYSVLYERAKAYYGMNPKDELSSDDDLLTR